MNGWRICICAALIPLWLAACTAVTKPGTGASGDGPVFTTAEVRAVMTLLDGFQRWHAMPADDQARELTMANSAYIREAGDSERLRLALLLSMPNTAFRDDGRALSLLEPVLAAPANPPGPLKQLAFVLQTQLADRMRALRDEQKRADELSQKLDALRKLERSLIEREQRVRLK